jgi:hypothetical protein
LQSRSFLVSNICTVVGSFTQVRTPQSSRPSFSLGSVPNPFAHHRYQAPEHPRLYRRRRDRHPERARHCFCRWRSTTATYRARRRVPAPYPQSPLRRRFFHAAPSQIRGHGPDHGQNRGFL